MVWTSLQSASDILSWRVGPSLQKVILSKIKIPKVGNPRYLTYRQNADSRLGYPSYHVT